MEGKEAQPLENIPKPSPRRKNKQPQDNNQDSPNRSDQNMKLSHKQRRRCPSPHCSCSKKMKCPCAGGNSSDGIPLESMMMLMNGKPRICSRPASLPPTVLPLVPLDRMGPLPPQPLLVTPPFLEPARSQGSSNEVRMVDKAKKPSKQQQQQPPQASHDNNENSSGTAEEFMEVTSSRAVKPLFDLNLPPPEDDEWMYS